MAHSQFTLHFLYGVYYHEHTLCNKCVNTNCSPTYKLQADRVISDGCKAVYYREIIQIADNQIGQFGL